MGDSLEHLGAWDCYTRLLPCLHCTPPPPSPESIISLNRPPGNVDDYVGVLPYLHCGGEKGKPCTYFETLCLCHMSSARSTSDGRGPVTHKRVPDRETPPHPLTCFVTPCMYCLYRTSEGRGIAPFLAFVPDNGFKSVCQLKWAYSITHPHSDVHRSHPHPHHTPLVNGLQHLYARN